MVKETLIVVQLYCRWNISPPLLVQCLWSLIDNVIKSLTQNVRLSSELKIDMVVITSISSHHGSCLCLGCHRNLRFKLLLLASDEALKQDWLKKVFNFTCHKKNNKNKQRNLQNKPWNAWYKRTKYRKNTVKSSLLSNALKDTGVTRYTRHYWRHYTRFWEKTKRTNTK